MSNNVHHDLVKDIVTEIDKVLCAIQEPRSVSRNDYAEEYRQARLDGMEAALSWVSDMLNCDYRQEFEKVAESVWKR